MNNNTSNIKKNIEWDFEKSEKLIELVRFKNELYDLKSPYYIDTIRKRNVWNDIGLQLNLKGSECKERWESLRSQYRKHVNKKKTKSGQAAYNIANWKYESQMSFLNEYMKDRSRITSVVVGNDTEEENSDGTEQEVEINELENRNENGETNVNEIVKPLHDSQSSKLRKRKKPTCTEESASSTLMKYLVEQKKEESPPHPIDKFFSLMASRVKNFNPVDQHFIITKLFSLVSDIEVKYLKHNQNQVQNPTNSLTRTTSTPYPSPTISQYSGASTSSYQAQNENFDSEPISQIQPYTYQQHS